MKQERFPLPPAKSARDHVREKLADFSLRQGVRERRRGRWRAAYRAQRAALPPPAVQYDLEMGHGTDL